MEEKKERNEELFQSTSNFAECSDVILYQHGDNCEDISYFNLMTGIRDKERKNVLREGKDAFYLEKRTNQDIFTFNAFYVDYNKEHDVLVMYTGYMQDDKPGVWQDVCAMRIFEKDGSVYENPCDKVLTNLEMLESFDDTCRFDACRTMVFQEESAQNMFEKSFYDFQYFSKHAISVSPRTWKLYKDFYGVSCLRNVDPYDIGFLVEAFDFNFAQDDRIPVPYEQSGNEKEDEILKNKLFGYKLPYIDKNIIAGYFEDVREKANKSLGDSAHRKTRYAEFPNMTMDVYRRRQINVGIVQHVADNLSAIRVFACCRPIRKAFWDEEPITGEDIFAEEQLRIFVGRDEPTVYKRYVNGWHEFKEFQYQKSGMPSDFLIAPWKPEDSVGTNLTWFDGYIERFSKEARKKDVFDIDILNAANEFIYSRDLASGILSFLVLPYAASIVNSGCNNVKEFLFESVEAGITDSMMGIYFDLPYEQWNPNSKNLAKELEIPVHIFKTLDEFLGREERDRENMQRDNIAKYSIINFKHIFRSYPEYLKNINADQFKELFLYRINAIDKWEFYCLVDDELDEIIQNLVTLHGPKNILKYMEYIYKTMYSEEFYIKDSSDCGIGWDSAYEYFLDYTGMCIDLKRLFPHTKWKFKHVRELIMAHDDMMEIYNRMGEEEMLNQTEEAFKEVKAAWKGYDYKEEEFSVVIPKKAEEIVTEGLSLNHCVKTYIQSVCDGLTNIFFIRRTDDLKKPFYTLEVKNGKVRQCHGFGNCNIDKVDGLEDFLKRYCEKKNIKYENANSILAVG
jgi:hypothetical protein